MITLRSSFSLLGVAALAACGSNAQPPPMCPQIPTGTLVAGTTPTTGTGTPPVTTTVDEPPTAASPWQGTLVFDDSDQVRAVDLSTGRAVSFALGAPRVEGLRNVAGGGASWLHWKDTALRPHAFRMTVTEDGGVGALLVESEVDDVAPDGKQAIITCPKKANATCVVDVRADGLGIPTPIKWPKGAGRVHGWTTDGKVLVLTSTLRAANLIEFEPASGVQVPRGTLPKDAQAFFDRDGKFVAWFEGGRGKELTLVFREVMGKDADLRRLALGVAHDARCEPTPSNDAWACVVFPASGEPGRLLVAALADLAVREIATGVEKIYGPFAYSPGGDAVAISQQRGDKSLLGVVPLAGGAVTAVWRDEDHFVSRPRPLGWLR